MYQGFAKFIRGKVFPVIFLIVSFFLIGYISIRSTAKGFKGL